MVQIALAVVSAAGASFLLTFLKALLSDSHGRGYGRRQISRKRSPVTGVPVFRRDPKLVRTHFLPRC